MQQVIRRRALTQTGDKTQTVVTDWTITTDWPSASACTVVYICSTRLYQPINSLSSPDPPMGPERLVHYITGYRCCNSGCRRCYRRVCCCWWWMMLVMMIDAGQAEQWRRETLGERGSGSGQQWQHNGSGLLVSCLLIISNYEVGSWGCNEIIYYAPAHRWH